MGPDPNLLPVVLGALVIACSTPAAPDGVDPAKLAAESKAVDEPAVEPAPQPAVEPASASQPTAPVDPGVAPETCEAGVLALIDDDYIPMSAHEQIMALKRQKYSDRGREVPQAAELRYRRSLAARLIDQRLLALEAARLGVDYDAAALAQREAAMRAGIEDWSAHLSKRGESDATLREIVIAELRERAILDARGELELSDEEIRAEYEQVVSSYDTDAARVRASHILVTVDPARPDRATEAKAKAEAERLASTAPSDAAKFAELARRESDGPSARKGGDLGLFEADRMPESFSDPVFAAKPGEIVMVQTKFGFHVVLVVAHYNVGKLPLAALEDTIRERLAQRKLLEARRALSEQLRESHEVVDCEAERLGPDPSAKRERSERPKRPERPDTP